MPATRKVAISIPKEMARRIEHLRRQRGLTRSAFVVRAIRREFQAEDRARRLTEYQEGYRRRPETDREVAAAERAATTLLAEEPWE